MLLVVLDGWGERADPTNNAIAEAKKPNWDYFTQHYATTTISGSGRCVGLPDGQMGNSEVGHMNLGLGRVVYQDYTRINTAIETQDFFKNPAFFTAITQAHAENKTIHILGLLSPGGVHSHEQHIFSLIKLLSQQGVEQVAVHAFLDGRDTPPKSAAASLTKLEQCLAEHHYSPTASICGRYYAMDRDNRWDRIEQAYNMLTSGEDSYYANNALEGLQLAYQRGETDEFVKPTVLGTKKLIQTGDIVIFMNFRADRARQLSYALTNQHFTHFKRRVHPTPGLYITLTDYASDLEAKVAYLPQTLLNGLGQVISNDGLHQLRIAETEKYAHVTFFFNGGIETVYPGEDRILIPSVKVATYDLEPQMSAYQLTEQLVSAIRSEKYDFIVCNFANADMVGHTGNLAAAIIAIETIDICLGEIYQTLKEMGGEMLITADHGNAEYMYDTTTHQPHTAHTTELVPLIYVGRPAKFIVQDGKLADVAPTLLYLMHLTIPKEMEGRVLLKLQTDHESDEH